MKFSYRWLSELVEGLDTDPRELTRLITMKTAECEGVEHVATLLDQASPARVISVEPIGDSHNRRVVVETPAYGVRTLVCGAPNCRPGLMTVYVPVGRKVIEGVESDGMLASGKELGVNNDHEGIVELDPEFPFASDWIIEVDNKSLTHRPDLWGHLGMAREVAAITGRRVTDPVRMSLLPQGESAILVEIENYELCSRYSALLFENVTVRPSPLWLQYRLEAIGLNPINNIVDVTNFVLAELPQPMHAFDAAKLRGGKIIVRPARPGESVPALNGETYATDSSNLLICDAEGPVAIAGVIGGMESSISDSTTSIVLESANFNAASIRKTSTRLKLRTDASMRFEKSQDPLNTARGLARAVELLQQVSPGIRLVGGLVDNWRQAPAPPPVTLPLDWMDRKLGTELPADEVRRILESLHFTVKSKSDRVLSVAVPSWRATRDVSIKDDLVEEVGRMVGYASITPAPPQTPTVVPPGNPERVFEHRIRDLASAQGFTEVYNYSFFSDEMLKAFRMDADSLVEVANPIASDRRFLRNSLVPGIWKNIVDNVRHLDYFRFFEIGKEIHLRPGLPPEERPRFLAAIYSRQDATPALFELKRLAECLLKTVRVDMDAEPREFEHPRRVGLVRCGDSDVGRLFEFHPNLVETGRAAVLDLDLTMLQVLQPPVKPYQPLRRFPTSAFDLSVIVPPRSKAGDLHSVLAAAAGESLVEIDFLRTFALPDGSNSISYRITIGASEKTLSNEDVTAIREQLIAAVQARGWSIRG
ncbi:MAG: phenylalanine--tRNA ligase subunit beta [Bryobacteraceae bacterium]|nr:phenylalanine--tRNA ligase subunit beta [Bryobacteraceae bacterium]